MGENTGPVDGGSSPGADATTDDVPDEIVRSIHIEARAQTVWDIVSEPGWFINDGAWAEHEITTEGDVSRVVDPVHGEFTIADHGSGVVLTVRETGFAGLHDDALVRRRRFEENSGGWVSELELARVRAEGGG